MPSYSENPKPFAIIINGTSSVGKSSAAERLQLLLADHSPILLGIDAFVNMLPQPLVGDEPTADLGFRFVREEDGTDILVGEYGDVVVGLMHEMAIRLLELGKNVIIDHVVLTLAWAHQLEKLCSTNARVITVLLECELSELEKRERERQNRRIGLARQLRHVNDKLSPYTLTINTTNLTPDQVANQIHLYLMLAESNAQKSVEE